MRPIAIYSVEQPTKEELLSRVAEMLEEIGRSGPYTVAPEWFTLDLSMPRVRALFLLLEHPLRMNRLASTLGVSFSRATALIDSLVEKDLVTRWTDPEDRRSVLCAVSEAGRELSQRLLAERRSRWGERLAPLSLAQLKKVCRAMDVVREAVRRSDALAEAETVTTHGG